MTCQWPLTLSWVWVLSLRPVLVSHRPRLSLWLLSFKNYYVYFVWGFGERVPMHL